jgi:hypothetical protein
VGGWVRTLKASNIIAGRNFSDRPVKILATLKGSNFGGTI